MCMCSGVGESSVFQNAVTAVRAHVPVLAWDGMFMQGERIKNKNILNTDNASMVCRSVSSGQIEFLHTKQQIRGFLVFQQSDVLQV